MIHLYGLIIGISIVVGMWLIELKAQQENFPVELLSSILFITLLGGLLGARFYHVIMEWHLYQNSWPDILKVWRGGLSIIGGVMGGVVSVSLFLKFNSIGKKIELLEVLDLAVFGLPIAQALGRWGNYFNQELYGLPTNLPWGIYIEPVNRLEGYENFTHFHPLFLYEMLLMLMFGGVVWWLSKKINFSGFQIGSGKLFILYIFYYSFIRFYLDFIRIDKMNIFDSFLGVNQVLLLGMMIFIILFITHNRLLKK